MVGRTGAALKLPEQRERPVKEKTVRRHVKRRVEPLTAYGLFVAAVVGMVLLYVAQYAYVAQLNLRLNRAENRLAEIQTVNEQLEQQASELKSLQRVEHEALSRLGMQKPQAVRTVRARVEPAVETAVAVRTAEPPTRDEETPSRLMAFLNWTRGLRQAFAQGIGENR